MLLAVQCNLLHSQRVTRAGQHWLGAFIKPLHAAAVPNIAPYCVNCFSRSLHLVQRLLGVLNNAFNAAAVPNILAGEPGCTDTPDDATDGFGERPIDRG